MKDQNTVQGVLPQSFLDKLKNGMLPNVPDDLKDMLLNGKLKGLPTEIVEALERGENIRSGQVSDRVEHKRMANYSVEVVTGAIAHHLPGDRIELSFYADRPLCDFEIFSEDNPNGGDLHSIPVKEHVSGISLSINDLKNINGMLTRVLERIENQD